MKKILALILTAVFMLSFVGCTKTDDINSIPSDIVSSETQKTDNKPSIIDKAESKKKGIKKIVDKSHKYLKTGTITKFYEEDYGYFCVSGKSDGIIVYFKDGTKMGITEAFEKKKVTLTDLDNFGVKYIKDFAGSEIFDLTETYDCNVKNKPQEFYKDKNFSYFFQSAKADYVKYRDYSGKTWRVADALKLGIIKPYDIGNSNIDFGKKYLGNELLIVNESEGYPTTQALMEFYRDDDFKYEFSSGISVVVYYPDGTKQGVTEALESGKIKVTDLDKFGIKYIKTQISNPKKMIILADLTETGKYEVDDAEEEFHRDDKYIYLFPTQKAKYVIVKYGKDNSQQTVKEALKAGKIKITALDKWDIDYIKKPIK